MRFAKALGLWGYVTLLVAVALVVLWIGMAAGDHRGTMWAGTAAVVMVIISLASLTVSRRLLVRRDPDNRPEQDPLQPAVTDEEAADYEARYHGRADGDDATDR
ncbi:hypothetical protein HH308_25680 [Gordonia sp. TBRC 11910]|uniref:Uncharacterized protein n=1 Tax=Gordonia asplenii TaxID=2725283 RepID=A0A848L2B3_9ACTN|nr:hypothetical protein [Gordonia asplenii]NMO04617.1 hypothetical protein [Gordonia asplenii]